MADATVDNGALADIDVSSKTLSGGQEVQGVELVTAVEGGARTDLAKAEDAAHVSGDFGIPVWLVRTDTPAARAGTDGDYMPFIADNLGRVYTNVGSAPAAARTTDHVGAAEMTGVIMQGLTERTPAYAIIDAATSGNNTLLSAQGAGNKIRVYSAFLVSAGTVNVRFESGADGTALTGQMNLVANTGFVLPHNPLGWFETAANALLNLELSAAISVDGCFVYSVVT